MRPTVLAFAFVLLTGPAKAGKQQEAEATPARSAYEYRKYVFKGIAMHLKAATLMARGKVELRATDLMAHARALDEMAQLVPLLFPADSGPEAVPESRALPPVWSDPEGFRARVLGLQSETAKLLSIAQGGDVEAYKAQVGKVAKSCGACHDVFRKPEEEDAGKPTEEK